MRNNDIGKSRLGEIASGKLSGLRPQYQRRAQCEDVASDLPVICIPKRIAESQPELVLSKVLCYDPISWIYKDRWSPSEESSKILIPHQRFPHPWPSDF